MKYRLPSFAFLFASFVFNFLTLNCLAQEKKYTISGVITDAKNGETLIGASVQVIESGRGSVTNTYGFYSLTLPEGKYSLKVELNRDLRKSLALSSRSVDVAEVVISAEATKNIESTEVSNISLSMEKIKALPAFMGEVDLIKTIQLLPGVMSAGEGNSGLYVRGGGPDQNLILVDDATVYNAAHLFGFFSIFNADAVKNVELIKGGMPAQYGGRLASVLDISLKEGNSKELQVDGGIGLIASRLTIQGPIKKDKISFIVSARRTYIDVLAKPFIPKTSNAAGSGYYFYDMNGKINWRISEKDQVYLSGYYGKDIFTFIDKDSFINFKVPWGNGTASARWNHLFSEKLFASTSLSFSDYNFQFQSQFDEFSATFYSGVRDYAAKVTFSYFPSVLHSIKFGANFTRHRFTPNIANAQAGATEFSIGADDRIFGNESGIFISDDFDVTDNLRINAGLRLSNYSQVGPFTRYDKDEFGKAAGERKYGKNEHVITYNGLEPRFSFRYKTGVTHAIKGAYTRNLQYIQLASISPLSLPTDIWIPSSQLLKPQLGNQFNIGYFRNLASNKYETSVEVYYKTMGNLIEYVEGAQPDDNLGDNVDNNITTGKGNSYGLELFVKKMTGKFNGWIGYTLSKTTRTFPAINGGEPFAAKYDRRHDLSIALTYDKSPTWSFGAVFVYATGSRITLPVQRYYSFEAANFVDIYGPRNSFKMAPYHRIDVSATLRRPTVKMVKDPVTGEMVERKKKVTSSWNFSIYNLYNRKNPYFLYNDLTGDLSKGDSKVVLKQVSLFPILPSVTWNFSF
ncbi:MAG: carboxypeptidase-like regulatory domain-containing protein [Bacteroidota bacterium]